MKRPPIPKHIEAQVLFGNDHTCCICRCEKNVSIHHINHDPTDNRLSNLTVVCPNCHDRTHGRGGFTRRMPPLEVRLCKRSWEAQIKKQRGIPRMPVRVRDTFKKAYWSCEISRLAYEIDSADDNDDVRRQLRMLSAISLYEGLQVEVLEAFAMPISLTALNGSKVPAAAVDTVVGMIGWLANPPERSLRRYGRRELRATVDAWTGFGDFASAFNRDRRLLNSIYEAALELFEIAVDCSRAEVTKVLAHNVWCFGANCMVVWKGENEGPFRAGRNMAVRTLRRMHEVLEERGVPWPSIKTLLTKKVHSLEHLARAEDTVHPRHLSKPRAT